MDYGIKDRTAVVTGADSGMGRSTARMLLEEGVRVVVSDKDADAIEGVADELKDLGEIHACAADVTDLASVEALKTFAYNKLGKVEFLVHGAGVTGPQGDFHTIDDDAWMSAIDIDLMGAVRTVRAFVTGMAQQKFGRIILFGSEDAEQPYPDELPYCAAKAAILNLSKGLSKAYAKDGILVNAVSPAFVATPMTDAMMDKRAKETGESFDETIQSFLKEERPTLELKRRGEVDEVAAAVLFLLSKNATFITGANLRIDGGSVATV